MLLIQHDHGKMVVMSASEMGEFCERFNPELLWTISITDFLTFLSYASFSVCLALSWKFIKPHFPQIKYIWIGVCLFVASCGLQHLLRTVGLWQAGVWWYIEAFWAIWVSIVSLFTAYIVFITYRKLSKSRSLRLALAITARVLEPKPLEEQLEESKRLQMLIEQMAGRRTGDEYG